MSTAIFCSNNFWPFPVNLTSTATLESGPTVPVAGEIVHWPIFNAFSGYPLPPFPPFFASFLTYLTYFLPPFLSVAPPGKGKVFAASNFACLYFYKF